MQPNSKTVPWENLDNFMSYTVVHLPSYTIRKVGFFTCSWTPVRTQWGQGSSGEFPLLLETSVDSPELPRSPSGGIRMTEWYTSNLLSSVRAKHPHLSYQTFHRSDIWGEETRWILCLSLLKIRHEPDGILWYLYTVYIYIYTYIFCGVGLIKHCSICQNHMRWFYEEFYTSAGKDDKQLVVSSHTTIWSMRALQSLKKYFCWWQPILA